MDSVAAGAVECANHNSKVPLCKISSVPAEGGLRVECADQLILAIFRVGDEYFVTDDLCTHGNASLSEGELIGFEVECPFHQGAFDVRTGAPTARPCAVALRTYESEVRGDTLYVSLKIA